MLYGEAAGGHAHALMKLHAIVYCCCLCALVRLGAITCVCHFSRCADGLFCVPFSARDYETLAQSSIAWKAVPLVWGENASKRHVWPNRLSWDIVCSR